MSKMIPLRAVLAAMPAAALVACGGGSPEDAPTARDQALSASSPTITAQSIAIESKTPDNLAIDSTRRYVFNGPLAAGYFSNQLTGTSVDTKVTTSDKTAPPSNGPVAVQAACTPATATLPAPAPDAAFVYNGHPGKDDWVGKNKCNLLDGQALTSTTYTQTASVAASCSYVSAAELQKNGTYKVTTTTVDKTDTYVWTYTVAQNDSYLNLADKTYAAWELAGETNPDGTVPVGVQALIAGQSVALSKNLGTKRSFSLLDGNNVPRVTNVTVGTDATNTVPLSWDPYNADQRLVYVDQLLEPLLDFGYYADPSNVFGNTTAQAALKNGSSAKAILEADAFWQGKPLGTALAAMRVGVNQPVVLNLGAGTHTLTFVATVKDNTGRVLAPVELRHNVNIVTPGCSGS